MTAPRPVTRARLAALLTARGIAYDEQLLTEIVEACKRQSTAPEAVRIYQEYAEQTPPKAFWESMEQNVKDLVLWEQIVSAYISLGWNKTNLSNMFEFYNRGEIPTTKGQDLNGKNRQGYRPTSGNEISTEQRAALAGY